MRNILLIFTVNFKNNYSESHTSSSRTENVTGFCREILSHNTYYEPKGST